MSSEIVIRAGRVEDLHAVVALEREVEEAPHWGEAEYRDMVGEQENLVARRLVVAEQGNRVVGFAVGKVIAAARFGELESVVVAPKARRIGVGRVLCNAVVAWCRGEGVDTVELEVRSANISARRLYEELGFHGVGVRRGYYRDPVDDAVLMRLAGKKQ